MILIVINWRAVVKVYGENYSPATTTILNNLFQLWNYKQFFLTPQLLEPRGVGGGVNDGVLNVPVAEIVLDQAGVGPLIR